MDTRKHGGDPPRSYVPPVEQRSAGEAVRQKSRALDADYYKALLDKVDHLLKIGFIGESYYPEWLANPVLVIKPNEKWMTCIDFMNLNKACPKDSFPLPRINQ